MPWPIVFIGKNRRQADPLRGSRGNERALPPRFPNAVRLIVERFEVRFRNKSFGPALEDSELRDRFENIREPFSRMTFPMTLRALSIFAGILAALTCSLNKLSMHLCHLVVNYVDALSANKSPITSLIARRLMTVSAKSL